MASRIHASVALLVSKCVSIFESVFALEKLANISKHKQRIIHKEYSNID